MTTINLSLHGILLKHLGPQVTIPLTLQIDELLEYACEDDEIAVVWSIEDVQSVRPDLSDDQAWEVLKFAQRGHDANYGINWECLEASAEALYGYADDSTSGEGQGDE